MFSRKSGGMGGYAEYSFGKAGNFMANYTYGVSLVIANTAIAISAVGYGSEFLGATFLHFLSHYGQSSLFGLRLFLTSVVQELRVTSVHSPFGGVIIPVVGISIIGWKWFDGSMYVNSWNPHNVPTFEADRCIYFNDIMGILRVRVCLCEF